MVCGQQKQLVIAIAITHHPKIIILDVPSAALDPRSKSEMIALIKDLKKNGQTVIFLSDDMHEV